LLRKETSTINKNTDANGSEDGTRNSLPRMTRVIAGTDGCSSGWLCIEQGENGLLRPRLFRTTRELLAYAAAIDLLTIDIPIGLRNDGPREVDILARRLLGPRASSVFPAPVRAALDGESYLDACSRSAAACGKRLSKQAFAILPKISQVDNGLRADLSLAERVREVHPEVCFYFMNNQQPMAHPKKSGQGSSDRYRLLESHFGIVIADWRSQSPRKDAADDDLLDALVALWSAQRVRAGSHVCLPPDPPRDRFGLRMEMVA
jgi:predicted RNase H-like nuclease